MRHLIRQNVQGFPIYLVSFTVETNVVCSLYPRFQDWIMLPNSHFPGKPSKTFFRFFGNKVWKLKKLSVQCPRCGNFRIFPIFQSLRFYVKSFWWIWKFKTAIFAILRAPNFVRLVNFSLQKCQKLLNSKFGVLMCSNSKLWVCKFASIDFTKKRFSDRKIL